MELIKKVVDYFTWVIFVGLLFLGLIIYVTNTTYPGDKLYSFKLKFEDFVLATSSVLNKQVDFSIDLVSKRSKEVAKILTASNSGETLNRLDTQVELTAASIAQISDPVEKKKAAEAYIAKLNEASIILSEKEKELMASSTTYLPSTNTESQPKTTSSSSVSDPIVEPTMATSVANEPTTVQQPTAQPTSAQLAVDPVSNTTNISEQINNSQQTIQETIIEMNNIRTDNRDFKKEHKPELKKELINKLDEKSVGAKDNKNLKEKKEDK